MSSQSRVYWYHKREILRQAFALNTLLIETGSSNSLFHSLKPDSDAG